MIFLDTHVLVWLYEGLFDKIPKPVHDQLNSLALLISPMVELELDFLYEIGRISVSGVDIVRYFNAHFGLTVSNVEFYRIIEEAQALTWTRDPFDRLIVANASIYQAKLITKDAKIQKHYPLASWELL